MRNNFRFTRRSLGVGGFLLFTLSLVAQPNPIKWSFSAKDAGNCQVDLIFTGILEEGWCTYSQFLESEDGPVATTLNFQEGANYKLLGKAVESGEIINPFDVVFGGNLTKFKHKAILTQRVEVIDPSKPIAGDIFYMACNHEMCLPPKDADFSIKIPALKACAPKSSKH
jgi:hypothetical protein